MRHSTEEANNMVNGFCNPHNALFVSQNSQETNESFNIEQDHNLSSSLFEEELTKKDSSGYQDCITTDLLKQIESNSPIKNDKSKTPLKPELSKFSLQHHTDLISPISANGTIPSFFPKKNNLWKQGNGRYQPQGNLNPFSYDNNQIQNQMNRNINTHLNNERYLPQVMPRNYLTPKNQCVSFPPVFPSNEKGWICCSCSAMNSEMKSQCFRCNYMRLIPSFGYPSTVMNNTKVPLIITNQPQSQNDCNRTSSLSPNTSNSNNNEATKISLTLREIAQINQMQYNQLKKINQLKELQSNDKQKKYNTPILSSGLKDKFENSTNANSVSSNNSNNFNKKKKKPFAERAGDWVCVKCKNLNFSFRSSCNRCQISKNENDKLYEQYMNNLMNYCKVNDMLQLKYNSPNTSFPQWVNQQNIESPSLKKDGEELKERNEEVNGDDKQKKSNEDNN